jgi:signal transduction histidine kinase
MGLGDGSVGGYILSFKKIGLKSGDAAVKILKGADPKSIKIIKEDSHEYLLDWRELKRWEIADSEQIPNAGTILFRETSFFEKYKLAIISALVFLILQTLFIVNLILMNRRQRKMTIRLKEAENKYRELIHEDRILRIGQLTGTLAHELNQPLTAILSTAQAGIRFIESNNAEPGLLKEIFQNIVEDDKRTAAILSSIRGMMKMEKREKEKVDLNSLVEELIAIYRSEAIEHKVRMDVRLLNEHVYVLCDRIQLQQVIMNFILNARQAMDKINTEKKTITITEHIQQGDVIISVRDNGEGIDESLKANIFKPFVTSKKEGFGVGLAISRSIIEDHHGKIWAENLPDGGAEFSFSLKICSNKQ